MSRDPRIDPQPGDILRRAWRKVKPGYNTYTTSVTRLVMYREFGVGKTIMANRVQVRDNGKDKRPSLKQFRQWAKKAEVLHVADAASLGGRTAKEETR